LTELGEIALVWGLLRHPPNLTDLRSG
jgi:hypothetical protein